MSKSLQDQSLKRHMIDKEHMERDAIMYTNFCISIYTFTGFKNKASVNSPKLFLKPSWLLLSEHNAHADS